MTLGAMDGFFLMFSSALLLSALGVVFCSQAIYGVLCLMLCFLNTAALWLLLEAEFLAMVLIIVYVGAVTVFFLFVVMMLAPPSATSLYRPASWMTLFLGAEFVGAMLLSSDAFWAADKAAEVQGVVRPHLGSVLYTEYAVPFQMMGLILLIGMIGAIVLVLKPSQKKASQTHRPDIRARHVLLKKIPLKQGYPL